jgi:hypothetical protein
MFFYDVGKKQKNVIYFLKEARQRNGKWPKNLQNLIYCLFNYIHMCPFYEVSMEQKNNCNLLFKGGHAQKCKMAKNSPEPEPDEYVHIQYR